MADRALTAMGAVVRIRRAQWDAAKAGLLTAEAGLARVRDAERERLADRDAAVRDWHGLLAARSPDPALVRLAGDWLTGREQGLVAARLDTAIALGGCETAAEALGRAGARLDASRETRSRLRREAMRRREASELAEAADSFLQRWRA
jgi:hypothetical protein